MTGAPWGQRHTDVTIWLWSLVTNGDPARAPMVQTATPVRRSTDQAICSYTTLRPRAAPALQDISKLYAEELTDASTHLHH